MAHSPARVSGLALARVAPLAPAALALALAGCVLSPTWGESPSSRRDPLDLNGMASRASAPLRFQAWNYNIGGFETIRTFNATTTRFATDPDLYSWSIASVALADRHWSPGATCDSNGMANLRVQEINTDGTATDLATFDSAGIVCLNEHMGAGEHPVAAGNACKLPDETIVLFTPTQCIFPALIDTSPATVNVRLADNTRAWQTTTGGANLTASVARTATYTATAMARDPQSAISRVTLYADINVTCRRTSDGTFTLVPRGWNVPRTQTINPTVRTHISLDASRAIDMNQLVTTTCTSLPGTTFSSATGTLFATGANATGALVTSPTIRFTL